MVQALGDAHDFALCASTGLNLVRSGGRSIFRVAKSKFGPLDPPERAGDDPSSWSRWDTPGRTIYGGTTPEGAFVEVLEYIDPDPPKTPMSDLFDDVDESDALTLDEQIARELPRHGAMPYRSISRGWRQARNLYEIKLPVDGWFVDITGAESISVITRQQSGLLRQCGLELLTLSELTDSSDEQKILTTGIATWIRERVTLEDGSRPHGVVYPSKWGSTIQNWAMWLRRTDDGTGPDPVDLVEASDIGQHFAPFVSAAQLRGMTFY